MAVYLFILSLIHYGKLIYLNIVLYMYHVSKVRLTSINLLCIAWQMIYGESGDI